MKNYFPIIFLFAFLACNSAPKPTHSLSRDTTGLGKPSPPQRPPLDTARYDQILKYLSNGDTSGRWPVKNAAYPLSGAVLPYNRIIAYYGNLYSRKMGALGEYKKKDMLSRLMKEVKKWSVADSILPAVPALHYIAVTAQGDPGKDGKYRYRMPFSQIDTIINWAKSIHALVFIDVQIGLSTVQEEIPLFEKYLSMPNVHLGIDPEFAMAKKGKKPGTVIGNLDASEINFVGNYLAGLVKKYNIPPKILVIHRFTQGMVTNTKLIKTYPELQLVMDMDGWGNQPRKRSTYYDWINPEPVQFTGFKIFYKNDTKRVGAKEVMQPADVIRLRPRPVYIQYQ